MSRDIKKVIYYILIFGGTYALVHFNSFNILSYMFGMIIVYIRKWCYRDK